MSGSRVPEDIPELGKASERPRQNPAVAPTALPLTAAEYFVLSRIDGHTSLRELIIMLGVPVDEAVATLQRLRALGAVLREGEDPARVAEETASARRATAAPATPPATPAAAPGPAAAEPLEPLTDEEAAAMAEESDLTEAERQRILAVRRKVGRVDYFALLGVPQDVSKRDLRRAYFRLSKEFHPDRYYSKSTGPFGPWLALVFETLSRAFEVLSDDKARQRYEASLAGAEQGSQSRPEYATELFERACAAEGRGDLDNALVLFAATVRVDAQARYLSRAARCALAAGRVVQAEEYAKNAAQLEPRNPSIARVLAETYRAAGKLREAQETLIGALSRNQENDALAAELQADLDRVHVQITGQDG